MVRVLLLVASAVAAAITAFGLARGGTLPWIASQKRAASLTGVVEAREVDVAAEVRARLVAVHVEEGDTVAKGARCATLDSGESAVRLQRAQARLSVARAELDDLRSQPRKVDVEAQRSRVAEAEVPVRLARAEIARGRMLRQSGTITAARLEELIEAERLALQRRETAQRALEALLAGPRPAQLRGAEARVQELEQEVQLAELDLKRHEIAAPIDGIVLRRNFSAGEIAQPGAPLLTLIDPAHLRVELSADERLHAGIAVGQRALVVAESAPGTPMAGRVSFVAERHGFTPRNVQSRDERSRVSYRVQVRVDAPPPLLKPGMFVEVTFPDASANAARPPAHQAALQ